MAPKLFFCRWARVLGPGLAGLLAGCQPAADQGAVLLRTDYEQLAGWGTALPLTTERAHSGRYALRLAAGEEFAGSYRAPLRRICPFVPTRLRLQSWVYFPSGRARATNLVVQVLCHGRRPDVWQALAVDLVVQRYQKWERVFKYIRLPPDLDPSDELHVYVWHSDPGGENVFFDDLSVEGWR